MDKKIIVWQNPSPSSTAYSRPIKFTFKKETDKLVLQHVESIRSQIAILFPTIVKIQAESFEIISKFEETMVDGKSNKAAQKCYICKATPKTMNGLEMIRNLPKDVHTFSWGLSTLHAQIRLMECVLYIGYRLDVKTWQYRKPEEKCNVAARKKMILERFRLETGLLLDTPKQGDGNSNDGNSARRFFKDLHIAADITGVNKSLIERLYVLLRALTSGYEINISAFKEYCDVTANLYVSLYEWYPMPVTLHKIHVHGPEVIQNFLLPIGQMSEEAQESRHKAFKHFQMQNARKISRCKANEDVLHNLLMSSDPVLNSFRPKQSVKALKFNLQVLQLLQTTHIEYESDVKPQEESNYSSTSKDSDETDYSL